MIQKMSLDSYNNKQSERNAKLCMRGDDNTAAFTASAVAKSS